VDTGKLEQYLDNWQDIRFKKEKFYSETFSINKFGEFFDKEILDTLCQERILVKNSFRKISEGSNKKEDFKGILEKSLSKTISIYQKFSTIVVEPELEDVYEKTDQLVKKVINEIAEFGELYYQKQYLIYKDKPDKVYELLNRKYVNNKYRIVETLLNLDKHDFNKIKQSLERLRNCNDTAKPKTSSKGFLLVNEYILNLISKIITYTFFILFLGLLLSLLFPKFFLSSYISRYNPIIIEILITIILFSIIKLFLGVQRYSKNILLDFLLPFILSVFIIVWIFHKEIFPLEIMEMITNISRIISVTIILFWIPNLFLKGIKLPFITNIILSLFIAVLAILVGYSTSTVQVILLVILNIIIPIVAPLSLNARKVERSNSNFRLLIFLPLAITLPLSFIITQDSLFLIGSFFWWVFWVIANISYSHFRPTYDLIAGYNNEDLTKHKHVGIFISLLVGYVFIIFCTYAGIEKGLLIVLNNSLLGLSITLIGFLLALQGILNTYSYKSTDKDKIKRFLENRILLKMLEGLKGFLFIFMILFLISSVGFIVLRYTPGGEKQVLFWDLVVTPYSFGQIPSLNTLNLLNFNILILFFLFSVTNLYYMFLAGNLLAIPLKLRDGAGINIRGLANKEQEKEFKNKINELLYTLRLMSCIPTDITLNKECLSIELQTLASDKLKLIEESVIYGKEFVEDYGKVRIAIKSSVGNLGIRNLVSVEYDKDTLKFISKHRNKWHLEYIMSQIPSYRIFTPEFKEAQIL